jgi:hypothetical protein
LGKEITVAEAKVSDAKKEIEIDEQLQHLYSKMV